MQGGVGAAWHGWRRGWVPAGEGRRLGEHRPGQALRSPPSPHPRAMPCPGGWPDLGAPHQLRLGLQVPCICPGCRAPMGWPLPSTRGPSPMGPLDMALGIPASQMRARGSRATRAHHRPPGVPPSTCTLALPGPPLHRHQGGAGCRGPTCFLLPQLRAYSTLEPCTVPPLLARQTGVWPASARAGLGRWAGITWPQSRDVRACRPQEGLSLKGVVRPSRAAFRVWFGVWSCLLFSQNVTVIPTPQALSLAPALTLQAAAWSGRWRSQQPMTFDPCDPWWC